MSKIRILAIPSDNHGVGKFRIINPYSFLQESYPDDFHVDIKMAVENNDAIFEDYDIIVAHTFIHNNLEFNQNVARIKWLKSKGKIVIIDTDDYWEPDRRHPMYDYFIKTEVNKKRIEMLKLASYVSTTTPIYRDTIMTKLGIKNVLVFPNAIDENEPQFIPNPAKSDMIRFGWLGGSSHLSDIQLMSNGISLIHEYAKNKVQFVLCGFDLRGTVNEISKQTGEVSQRKIQPEETVWFEYEKIFTNNYRALDGDYIRFLKSFADLDYDDLNKPYRRRWTQEISKYANNYNTFDVSLAPLVDSVFNNNKSQLKAIESGFHKKALIASECNPYTLDLVNAITKGGGFNPKGNALLVSHNKDHKQWAQHMKRLINEPNLIEDLGNKLYEMVKDKYSLARITKDRVEFFKSIINK